MQSRQMDAVIGRGAHRKVMGVVVALVALVLVPNASAQPRSNAVATWKQAVAGPSALSRALTAHRAKLGPAFLARLRYAHTDGTLRVMVTARARTAATERLARRSSEWVQWYLTVPGFYAAVTRTSSRHCSTRARFAGSRPTTASPTTSRSPRATSAPAAATRSPGAQRMGT